MDNCAPLYTTTQTIRTRYAWLKNLILAVLALFVPGEFAFALTSADFFYDADIGQYVRYVSNDGSVAPTGMESWADGAIACFSTNGRVQQPSTPCVHHRPRQ
jgi:predicted Abi (CAAX) family protease